jgi:hypothetical protein
MLRLHERTFLLFENLQSKKGCCCQLHCALVAQILLAAFPPLNLPAWSHNLNFEYLLDELPRDCDRILRKAIRASYDRPPGTRWTTLSLAVAVATVDDLELIEWAEEALDNHQTDFKYSRVRKQFTPQALEPDFSAPQPMNTIWKWLWLHFKVGPVRSTMIVLW